MILKFEESIWGGKKAFVAKIKDKRIGQLVINDIYSEQNCIELYSFQVLYEYRKKYIGKELLMKLVNYAKEKGVNYLTVVPAPCNDLEDSSPNCAMQTPELIRVYQRLGFAIQTEFVNSYNPRMIYEIDR